MDSKQEALTYVTTPLRSGSVVIKQKLPSPPRSSSLVGISRYNEDRFSVYDDFYDKYNYYEQSSNHNSLRSSHIASLSPQIRSYEQQTYMLRKSPGKNPDISKEKSPNQNVPDYSEPWLCDIDLYKEKIKEQNGINRSHSKDFLEKYRYLDYPKCGYAVSSNKPIRTIKTRSESEPNDISSIKQWTPRDDNFTREEFAPKEKEENQNSVRSNEKCQYIKTATKRESPPKVLIYNNTCSPATLKKHSRLRSTTGLNSPRLNLMRKSKTKSSSPFLGRSVISSSLRTGSVHVTSKSNTSQLDTTLPTQSANVHSRISNYYDKSDTEGSSLEDDDDFEEHNESTYPHSSDSENGGYKKKMSVSNHLENPTSPCVLVNSENDEWIDIPDSPFAMSLFPYVPPYLAFSSHVEKGPAMPPQLHKILKWKLTTVMPRVVRRIVINSGFRLLKKTNDWMGTWGKHMRSPCFKTVRSYQKINHIPGSFKIGRKDCCWRNLQTQMAKYGKDEFGFMPRTYVIPQDLKSLRKAWPKYSQRNFKWIVKPPASARGTGIKVINRWSQIPKRKPVIVQRYIERPFLINGSKFDLRIYVLVTSLNPLRVYMYKDGLARFASVKYSDKPDTLNDRCMHLTNYSINKLSSNYSRNDDANACQGHKWTLKSLWSYFHERGINTNRLWGALRNLVLRTILAGENSINSIIKMNVESKYNCYELFGFDVILDSELVPWLLEVNISPSLHSELPLDLHVKGPLVQAVLNTALYQIPPKLTVDQQKEILIEQGLQEPLCFDKRMYVTYLSRAEKLKHNQFTRKSMEDRDDYLNAILENLTPDDLRCLMITEDELARSKPLERIFPGPNTSKYLKYTETPRYYNRLLDAWENRYSKDRISGIKYLQGLCETKMHLDVSQAPVKKLLKIRTRALRNSTTATTTIQTTKICWALATAVNSIKRRNKKRILKKSTSKSQNQSSTATSTAEQNQNPMIMPTSTATDTLITIADQH